MVFISGKTPRQGQRHYRDEFSKGYPGRLQGLLNNATVRPYINARGQVGIYTIDPPVTPDTDATYYLMINQKKVEVDTGVGGMTDTELMDAFESAIHSHGGFYRLVDMSRTGNTLTFQSRNIGEELSIVQDTVNILNPLTIAETQSPSTNAIIPFGRFVVQIDPPDFIDTQQYAGSVGLPSLSTDPVKGVSMASFREKQGTDGLIAEGYRFGDVMDVLERTFSADGIWVECVESDLTPSDTVYISVSVGQEGKVTRTSASNIDFTARASIRSGVELNPMTGKQAVLVEIL